MEEIFQQDLSKREVPGAVFFMQLLMKEPVPLPDRAQMTAVLERRVGGIECSSHDEKMAAFAALDYRSEFKDASLPPQLMVAGCDTFDSAELSDFQKSQMWDCMADRDRIFSQCKYQVFATDMLAAGMPYKQRAKMDMDFMEALLELYPTCEAIYFSSAGKLFTAEQIKHITVAPEDRFVRFAVNCRFFNIQDSDAMMVDTLGMGVLFLPDLQYHFRGMDPNWVVHHAYSTASYLFDCDNPIQNGDSIDGIRDGKLDPGVKWKCHHEDALIQPVRSVIDVCMGEYAAGGRSYSE